MRDRNAEHTPRVTHEVRDDYAAVSPGDGRSPGRVVLGADRARRLVLPCELRPGHLRASPFNHQRTVSHTSWKPKLCGT